MSVRKLSSLNNAVRNCLIAGMVSSAVTLVSSFAAVTCQEKCQNECDQEKQAWLEWGEEFAQELSLYGAIVGFLSLSHVYAELNDNPSGRLIENKPREPEMH